MKNHVNLPPTDFIVREIFFILSDENSHGHTFHYTPCQSADKIVYIFTLMFAGRKAMEITMAIYTEEMEFFSRSKHEIPYKMQTAHFHEKHELYVLERGQTKYFIGSELYVLKPGDMIFVPKGEFHKTDSEEHTSTERILLSFNDDFAGSEYMPYINEMKSRKHIRLPQEQMYKIHDILSKMEKEYKKKYAAYEDMEKLYLKQLLILISRYRLKDTTNELDDTYRIIQDAARFISENCTKSLNLNDIAKRHAMSPAHFSRQFKKITGIGLSEYINITRVTAAEKLLLNTDMQITRIAEECGFNDSNYFAAVFKKIKGITPKKYSILYK